MSGRFEGRRVLALGDTDATLGLAQEAAAAFGAEGADLRVASLALEGEPEPPVFLPESLAASRLFRGSHLVLAALSDAGFRALFAAYLEADLVRESSRPLVLAVDAAPAGSGAVDWMAARAPADVLRLRSHPDLALYGRVAAALGVDATNAALAPSADGLFGLSEALLMGQDLRESALPLRHSLAGRIIPEAPEPPKPSSGLAAGLMRRLVRKGRSAPQH
ncbi:hypothetical protein JOD31_000486 [Methylopila capsulata]|uniref:Uncharacterized protein n=1 Tax=Methylopila capsulata TaxID=61654 RepID=A0A9W6ITW3_9HYPH|nr:hypothetical protein [Methylopila capsulata]MBM7850274.1 hypothetical protein [Methylopila capsulata]GLK55567.1 hypothetical protein GCM10008170_15860 [Methylopila capsulata]